MEDKFLEWKYELTRLTEITIPRSCFDGQLEKVELHVYSNSSQDLFSSVAFLRTNLTRGSASKTKHAFVFGKGRVAPMKPLTIPKLELQAASLPPWLKNEIRITLTIPVERTFAWTNSTAVLLWPQTNDKLPVFLANRVAEILELTTRDDWNYVWTSESPVDAGARGRSAHALSEGIGWKAQTFARHTTGLFNCQRTFSKKSQRSSPNLTRFHQDRKNKRQRQLPR